VIHGRGLIKNINFSVLSESEISDIHYATLDIMKNTGNVVRSEDAITMLKKAGCKVDGDLVKVPPHIVERAIATAPKQITIYDRKQVRALEIEGKKLYFGTGPTTPFTLDIYTGERRPTLVSDIELHSRVADALPNIDFVMPMGSVSDVPKSVSDLFEFVATVVNTAKPIPFISWNVDGLKTIIEICNIISGGDTKLQEKPYILSFTQPISPLQHGKDEVEKMLYSAEKGIPVIQYAGITMGGTGPQSVCGSVIQGNAEVLMDLVTTQLRREGAPFIIGISAMPMNMSNGMVIYGSPEYYLAMSAHTQVCQSYNIPKWGTAGLTDSKIIDEQAAIESTLCTFMAALSGNNMIHDCGYMESCMTGSAEMLVMQDEIINFVKKILNGIEIDQEYNIRELIEKVGPRGNYVEEEHTLKYFKKIWYSSLLDRGTYSGWLEKGGKSFKTRLNEKTRKLAESHQPEPLNKDILRDIERIKKRSAENRT
jgi:trimethylamine--corrinoid protein Co-methyltransferase